VCHSSELPMVFQPDGMEFNQNELDLSDYIQEFWSNLGYNGSPDEDWTAFESHSEAAMVFNGDGTFGVQHEYALMNYNCEFWDSLGYLHAGFNEFNVSAIVGGDTESDGIPSCNRQCDRRDA